MGPLRDALLPLATPVVNADAQLDDALGDGDDDEGQTCAIDPVLEIDAVSVPLQPLGYSEALIDANGTLREALTRVGGRTQIVIAVNAYFKTTQGKHGYLTVRGDTGFDCSDPASMAIKKGLENVEEAVRKQPGFLKLFPLALDKNPAVSANGMQMVGNFTGRAGEHETSRCSDAGEKPKFAIQASATTHTAKSSTTPAFLGERAQEMAGVVFTLQTNIDNSKGGNCVWIKSATNRLPANTMLRLLSRQERVIDMAK